MLATILLLSAMLAAASATAEETPPGDSFSPERHAYCEAERVTCEQESVAACATDSPPGCADDAHTWCSKEFTTCFESPNPPSSLPLAPEEPSASDKLCVVMFSRLRQFVGSHPSHFISVVWTTNYHAHGQLFAGRAALSLARDNPGRRFDLYGQGTRYRTNYSGGPEEERVSLRIRADGKIMLSDIYGPYDVVCSAGRFAVLYSGDSVEVFNFTLAQEGQSEP